MSDQQNYESLDPDNWEEMRKLGHRMIDDSIEYLKNVRERPAWQPVPHEVTTHFHSAAPMEPQNPVSVYKEFTETVLPYPMGNIHPRFWGWYMGNGNIMGALADFLSAVMNSNTGGGNHVATLVEEQVINWIKEIVGMPESASGLLVSGASMANLMGITVARNSKAGYNMREDGLQGSAERFIVYGSTEMHSSNQKAVELLGLGSKNLRLIPVNKDYTINIDSLKAAINEDRSNGFSPICVIGNAGTINTGAIDDLQSLSKLCKTDGLWFHVDGAIGAIAVLSETVKQKLSGIEEADSVALDLHKWLHAPFEAGCIIIRDSILHRNSFSLTPEYLQHETRGLAGGHLWFSDYGIQLSRSFKALKVWMSVKEHGFKKFGRMIDRNIEQANYFAGLVKNSSYMELMAPVGLDIVCFRFNPGGLDDLSLNSLNKEILMQIHEQGIAVPSYTTLQGKYCLRIAIANHRSTSDDFDLFAKEVVRIGMENSKMFKSEFEI